MLWFGGALPTDPKAITEPADPQINPLLAGWQRYVVPAIRHEQEEMARITLAMEQGISPFKGLFEKPFSARTIHEIRKDPLLRQFRAKEKLQHRYAWAVPSGDVLDAIVKLSPIVEMGAGTGYWACLLTQRGADVVAYDIAPPGLWHPCPFCVERLGFSASTCEDCQGSGQVLFRNHWCGQRRYFDVQPGDPHSVIDYADRTLFLCWPPYRENMAAATLYHFSGRHVVYIGEGEGGCTATDGFFHLLNERFKCIVELQQPQWSTLHDDVTIWRRR